MKLVVRDDDTCGLTSPEDLQRCYQGIWGSAPISLSVTPFRKPGTDWYVPKTQYGSMTPIPLEANTDLVGFLRDGLRARLIDVAIHGYHHEIIDGQAEYVAGHDLGKKTIHAKEYVSQVLGVSVKSFVPPHNAIGKEGLRAVIAAQLNLVHIASLWSPDVRDWNWRSWWNMPRFYWHRKCLGHHYAHVLDFGTHKELDYHSVGPSSDLRVLRRDLDFCIEQDGVFVLATHYHAFARQLLSGETVQAAVFALIDRAVGRTQVEFVGINSAW